MICKVCHYGVRRRQLTGWLPHRWRPLWRHVGDDWREFGWHLPRPGLGAIRLTRSQVELIQKLAKSQVA